MGGTEPRSPGTVADLLRRAAGALGAAGVDSAPLEAQLLLAYVLGRGRAWLLSHPESVPEGQQAARFDALLARRLQREPLAYLTGVRDWRDLTLRVGSGVLIPRPETEHLAELALAEVRARGTKGAGTAPPVVVDVGTGTGALAIAIARACPEARVYATDSSAAAVHIATCNVQRLAAGRVEVLVGDLLAAVPERADVVVANLPYVPTGELAGLAPELAYEPRSALDGGEDGLGPVRALFMQLQAYGKPGASVLLEIGHDQAAAVRSLARETWSEATVETARDLAGIDRFVIIRLPSAG